MSNDVEELLRDGMERTTAEVRMAPELAGRLTGQAASKHRRRLLTQAGGAGGTVLGVTVLGVTGLAVGLAISGVLSPAPGGTTAPRVQTAAYVIDHVNHALATAASGSAVAHIETAQTTPSGRQATTSWFYESARTKTMIYAEPGSRILSKAVSQVSGRTDELSVTRVDYPARQWLEETARVKVLPPGGACLPDDVLISPFASFAVMRNLVSCGNYIVAGQQRVGGVTAIKLVMAKPGNPPSGNSQTIWVDASTYLPVRVLLNLRHFQQLTDVQWLSATQANLTHLRLTIPAGFKRVNGPAVPIPAP